MLNNVNQPPAHGKPSTEIVESLNINNVQNNEQKLESGKQIEEGKNIQSEDICAQDVIKKYFEKNLRKFDGMKLVSELYFKYRGVYDWLNKNIQSKKYKTTDELYAAMFKKFPNFKNIALILKENFSNEDEYEQGDKDLKICIFRKGSDGKIEYAACTIGEYMKVTRDRLLYRQKHGSEKQIDEDSLYLKIEFFDPKHSVPGKEKEDRPKKMFMNILGIMVEDFIKVATFDESKNKV